MLTQAIAAAFVLWPTPPSAKQDLPESLAMASRSTILPLCILARPELQSSRPHTEPEILDFQKEHFKVKKKQKEHVKVKKCYFSAQEKRAQRLTFWVRRPPGGVGGFHAKGRWPKSSCPPSKVCLPWVSKTGIWDVPGIVRDVPDPWGCSKSLCKKSLCAFFVPDFCAPPKMPPKSTKWSEKCVLGHLP